MRKVHATVIKHHEILGFSPGSVIPAISTRIHYFILFCLLVFSPAKSFATPPTSITLTYDLNKGSLHVVAEHESFDVNKSYVRLMDVYVNGNQVNQLNYFRQNDPEEFTEDVPVTAQAGDVIKVDLFCTLGGEMAQELTVTKPVK